MQAVRDAAGLERFLHDHVVPALSHFELPMFARAHGMAGEGDVAGLAALDRELDAWRLAVELREASARMGSRRLALVRALRPDALLDRFAAGGTPQHLPVVCALEFRHVPVSSAACAFALQSVAGTVAAGVKLLRLGQERAQGIIHRTMRDMAPAIVSAVADPELRRVGWFSPLVEIASLRHARARERLFIS
jgi:urease accessory protein